MIIFNQIFFSWPVAALLPAIALVHAGAAPARAQCRLVDEPSSCEEGYDEASIEGLLEQAAVHREAGRHREAIALLRGPVECASEPRPRLLVEIGLNERGLGQLAEAEVHFLQAIRAGGRWVGLNRRALHRFLREMRPTLGNLMLENLAEDAELRIDGVRREVSSRCNPYRLEAGEHRVEVTMDGSSVFQGEIRIEGRRMSSLWIETSPVCGGASCEEMEGEERLSLGGTADAGGVPDAADRLDPNVVEARRGAEEQTAGEGDPLVGATIAGAALTGVGLLAGAISGGLYLSMRETEATTPAGREQLSIAASVSDVAFGFAAASGLMTLASLLLSLSSGNQTSTNSAIDVALIVDQHMIFSELSVEF